MSYYVIADIHGCHDKLLKVYEMILQDGFDPKKDYLIQVGDRNDRGPDTYLVNEFFRLLQIQNPEHVIVINGNHDQMMLDAADGKSDLMYYNGGNKTEQSYSDVTKIYGKKRFGISLRVSGHYDWLRSLPYYYETEDYFFCHAPIALEKYRSNTIIGMDFRQSHQELMWTYIGENTQDWVDPYLIPKTYGDEYKICVYGHIHGMKYIKSTNDVIVPGIRRYGNSILLDTGSGCHPDGYLTCLKLPEMITFNSKGEKINL